MSLIESSKLRGEHALFSPSTPSWLNYTDAQFIEAMKNKYRAQLGTEMHEWAGIQIQLGQSVSGVRDAAKSIKTMIFQKYFDERFGLSDFGRTLLQHLKYMPSDVYKTVKAYVNDSISDFMMPEEILEYSMNFFGTCDALNYNESKSELRIYDLKTGIRPAKVEQLLIYAALYCLKNHVDPFDITTELRIYQNCDVLIDNPDPNDIRVAMDSIIRFDNLMTRHSKGEL